MRRANVSHLVFALTLIGLGILGLIQGKFTPIWYGVPQSLPQRELLAYLCDLVCVACGAALLGQRTARVAAGVLLAYLLAWMILFRVPYTVRAPGELPGWWSCGESAVMVAAAGILFASLWGERGNRGLRVARVFYGLGLIPFGIAHFVFLHETVVLVPDWLPWHTAWAYLTGAAFIAAGVAIVIGFQAKLAAALCTLQMGLFTVLVWIPLVLTGSTNAFQWGEFVDSCVLTVAAWVVADSWRRGL
jgi:uncharacterized membrane protein